MFFLTTKAKVILFLRTFLNYWGFSSLGGQNNREKRQHVTDLKQLA